MYDGRRRNNCRELQIPSEIHLKTSELNHYIKENYVVDKHETTLPCILNTTFFKGKSQPNQKILNRLQTKDMATQPNGYNVLSLEKESAVRRNKLTLEHVMHQRG